MAKVPLREKLISGTGIVTRVWHRFFAELENLTATVESQPTNDVANIYAIDKSGAVQKQIDILEQKIETLLVRNTVNYQKQIDLLTMKLEIMSNNSVNYQKQIDILEKKIETLSKPVDYQKQIDLLNKHNYIF